MRSNLRHDRAPFDQAIRCALPFLSLTAAGVSIAAPGVGWVLGALVLTASAMLAQRTGKAVAAAVLAITLFHAVALGPFSGLLDQTSAAAAPVWFLMLLLLPFVPSIWKMAWMRRSDGKSQPAQAATRHRP